METGPMKPERAASPMVNRLNLSLKGVLKEFFMAAVFMLTAFSAYTQSLTRQAEKVQKLMPGHTVIAHRGTIFWAPELTEAAFRWGRNSGADYLELDVHRTKDGQLVVMHDKTLKRTTDVAQKFPGREDDPIGTFTLEEIWQLDAGSAFNQSHPEQARTSFSDLGVLVFEDVFRIAEGKRVKRNADGSRVFHKTPGGEYVFEYEEDPADNGHRPGIYIETKSPESYPGLEKQIYQELASFGWNPLEERISWCKKRFYKRGKVNVGNTKGKILIQTFSRTGMENFQEAFQGRVPTSFLIKSPKTDDHGYEEAVNEIIDFAHQVGAQFIGTNMSLNDGQVSNQDFLKRVRKSGLKVNVYSFNATPEMEAYFGAGSGRNAKPMVDGMITNRTDLTTYFYNKHNSRPIEPSQDPRRILDELGY